MKMMYKKKEEGHLLYFDEAIYDASIYDVVELAPEPKKVARRGKSPTAVPEEVSPVPVVATADYAIGRANTPDDFDFAEDV